MERENFLNNEIAERLLERLDYITLQPTVIADHSAENTVIAPALLQRYPQATHDRTHGMSDIIIAHAQLLREPDPLAWFDRIHRQLAINGVFLFSTVGPDTLHECRVFTDTLAYPDMHDLGDALVNAGFVDPVMEAERITLVYDDFSLLINEINALSLLPSPLNEKNSQAYPKNAEGQYVVTVEVVYGHAWKPAASAMRNGEARISVDSLRRRR